MHKIKISREVLKAIHAEALGPINASTAQECLDGDVTIEVSTEILKMVEGIDNNHDAALRICLKLPPRGA